MTRLHDDHDSWATFDGLVDSILGGTEAKNSHELHTGWTAKWLWGTSISKQLLSEELAREGKFEEAFKVGLAANERRIVAAEMMNELRNLRASE
jgi:hypothetical protein